MLLICHRIEGFVFFYPGLFYSLILSFVPESAQVAPERRSYWLFVKTVLLILFRG